MEVLSRYQVLPREGPLPWFSGSPMQLHTVQLVLDQLSGRVLLQILAQNMTDQPMKSVCLRITCRDAAGTVLQEFPAVLLKNIYAAPHGTFHNRQNLYLPTGTASCDLLPERVFFQDGQVWDRPDYLQGQLLPPPTPVDPDASDAAALQQAAQRAGYHSDYYYEEHNDFWYCSCGQANPIAAMYCGRCCAPRSWLQANARHIPARRPAPRPDLQEYFGRSPGQYQPVLPTPPQEQLVCDPHTGELLPLEEYNSLMRAMYYQKQDTPPPAPPRRSHTGWIVALVLLCLAAAAVFLILPKTQYGRYQKAVSQMEAGQYDEAYAAFLALGDYDGAANQATSCRYYQAQRLYEAADWAAAGAIYESLGDYRKSPSLAADCQYRQALDAMAQASYEDAIDFLTKAQSLDESNTLYEQKLLECYYKLGVAAEDDGDDEAAIRWYEQCPDYQDAAARQDACEARLRGSGSITDGTSGNTGLAQDGQTQFGGQTDAAAGKSNEEMYAYVTSHRQREDATTAAYLALLSQANYRDSQQIYQSLYAWKVEIFFNTEASDLTTRLETATAAQTLYAHYIVSGGPLNGSLQLKYTYRKPNGATGEKVLTGTCASGSTGNIFWRGGIYAETEQQQAGTMQVSYYDAQTGAQLCTGSIAITLPTSVQTKP